MSSKPRKYFPDPRACLDPDGLILISDELSVEILRESYSLGVFPWPHEELPILWFCPPSRGVLRFENLHVSRKLKKTLKNKAWQMRVNTAFPEVIDYCRKAPRKGQSGTWITDHMRTNYLKFFEAGYVYSFECWQEDSLIGGLYGVLVDGVFAGESMFHLESDASKAALLFAISRLKKVGLKWMDIQMVTELLAAFGGEEMGKSEFLDKVEGSSAQTLAGAIDLQPESISEVMQFFLKSL